MRLPGNKRDGGRGGGLRRGRARRPTHPLPDAARRVDPGGRARAARLAHGGRAGAHLPPEQGHQLRPGRPRHGARRPRRRPDRLLGRQLLRRARHRPGGLRPPDRDRRVRRGPAVPPLTPPHPDGGDHRALPAPGRAEPAHPTDLGPDAHLERGGDVPLAPQLAHRARRLRRQRPGGGHRLGRLPGRRVDLVHQERRRDRRAGGGRPPRPRLHARHPGRPPADGHLGGGRRPLLREHLLPGGDPRPPARPDLRPDRARHRPGRPGTGQLHRAAGHRRLRGGPGHPGAGRGLGRADQPRARAGRAGRRGLRRHRRAPAAGAPHRPRGRDHAGAGRQRARPAGLPARPHRGPGRDPGPRAGRLRRRLHAAAVDGPGRAHPHLGPRRPRHRRLLRRRAQRMVRPGQPGPDVLRRGRGHRGRGGAPRLALGPEPGPPAGRRRRRRGGRRGGDPDPAPGRHVRRRHHAGLRPGRLGLPAGPRGVLLDPPGPARRPLPLRARHHVAGVGVRAVPRGPGARAGGHARPAPQPDRACPARAPRQPAGGVGLRRACPVGEADRLRRLGLHRRAGRLPPARGQPAVRGDLVPGARQPGRLHLHRRGRARLGPRGDPRRRPGRGQHHLPPPELAAVPRRRSACSSCSSCSPAGWPASATTCATGRSTRWPRARGRRRRAPGTPVEPALVP